MNVNALPEYITWRHMKTRCLNPNSDAYDYYGGRGITICARWRNSFKDFLADVGRRPSPKHTLDRYPNNNGNYELGNVRWATRKQQQSNTRRTKHAIVNGERTHVAEACRVLNLNENSVRYRLRSGWTVERALTEPFKKHVFLPADKRREIRAMRGVSQDMIAEIYGISQSAVSEIKNGR